MIKVFESFAGIGTQRMALKNQGIEHEVVAIAEVDEYAILSYHAIHTANVEVKEASEEEMQRYMEKKNVPLDPKGKRKILKNKRLKDLYVASVASNNLGDISKITDDEIPKVDLFTYSFPCQDISLAGEQKGLDKNSRTRSSLLWECEKIIEAVKPKYLLMENVKALVNKKNKPQFDIWLEYLEELGYKNFWQVLNAKDYGIPQNRERVFVVSILDENADYKFPTKKPLTLKLKDILEDNVDEKYYLKNDKAQQLIEIITSKSNITKKEVVDSTLNKPKVKEVMNAITARYDAGIQNQQSIGGCVIEPTAKRIGGIFDKDGKTHQAGAIWDKEQLAPTLDTMQGRWRQPSIIVGSTQKNAAVNKDGVCPTLTSAMGQGGGHVPMHNCTPNFKVRKLTPNECWRLMGITDENFEKANKVVSNSQLYKQAGNAIVVDVLEGIFKQLFNPGKNNGGKE